MRNLMCCPEAGSRPGTNVALPLWSPSWYRFTLPVMGVRSPMPPNAPPSPNSFFLLHESPVVAVLIDSFVFIHNEHSTASSNNTSTTTKFPSIYHIRSWDQTNQIFLLSSLSFLFSIEQPNQMSSNPPGGRQAPATTAPTLLATAWCALTHAS